MAYPLCTRCGGPDAPGHPCLRDRIDVEQGRQLLAMAQDGDQIPAARWLLHHGASLLYAAERLDELETQTRRHASKDWRGMYHGAAEECRWRRRHMAEVEEERDQLRQENEAKMATILRMGRILRRNSLVCTDGLDEVEVRMQKAEKRLADALDSIRVTIDQVGRGNDTAAVLEDLLEGLQEDEAAGAGSRTPTTRWSSTNATVSARSSVSAVVTFASATTTVRSSVAGVTRVSRSRLLFGNGWRMTGTMRARSPVADRPNPLMQPGARITWGHRGRRLHLPDGSVWKETCTRDGRRLFVEWLAIHGPRRVA